MTPNPPLSPPATLRQSDIADLLAAYRINSYPVAVRAPRETEAGGFADPSRFPYTWTVYFLVDGVWAHVESARGLRREWSSLDRLERWLLRMGFRFFSVRNDVEPAEETIPQGGFPMK